MTVTERITALRKQMKEKGIDAYLVPTDDFHGSEYVGDYFKCRKYITGFSLLLVFTAQTILYPFSHSATSRGITSIGSWKSAQTGIVQSPSVCKMP